MTIETANKLIELRKSRGLSQEELAERLNISRQAVSKWERAESSPDIDNIIELSRLYGISVDELLCNGTSLDEAELIEESRTGERPGSDRVSETVGTKDGVVNFSCSARAHLVVTGVDGDEASVDIEGRDSDRCEVFTEGDTLKVVQNIEEDARGFFGQFISNSFDPLVITVKLPRRMKSVEALLKGGSLKIDGLRTDAIRTKLGGGRVALRELTTGSLEIKNGGGSVLIQDVRADRAELATGGGSIKAESIDVPDRLEVKSGGGSIFVSGSVTETEAKTGGGDVRLLLSKAERVEAKTGGGGVTVELTGCTGVNAGLVTGGGRARLIYNGEEIMSARSIRTTVGDGSCIVEAKSGGGAVSLTVNG